METVKDVMELPKNALLVAFEKAHIENQSKTRPSTFDIGDFERLFENTSITGGSSSSCSNQMSGAVMAVADRLGEMHIHE